MTNSLFGILVLILSLAQTSFADTMFEGYFRIDSDGKHIGYSILRYEFDAASKTFQAISFLRATIGDQVIQETYKCKATDRFEPISYQYTAVVGKENKMIDATFKGQVMNISISDGKKVRKETHKIPKSTFFSSFLPYMMLQKKLSINQAFQYEALAEEEGNVYSGKSMVESKEKRDGYELLKILNSYKGEKFISTMAVVRDGKDPEKNIRGEVFDTNSPVKKLTTKLVTSPSLATEGQTVPNKILMALFGGMPTGKLNLAVAPPTPAPAASPKTGP